MALRRGGLLALTLLAAIQAASAAAEAGKESERESKEDAAVPTLGPPQPAPQLPDARLLTWDRYDCFTGVDSFIQQGWSQDQKDYCCQEKDIGCEGDSDGHPKQPFECRDVMEALIWPDEKRIFCCENKELGCAVNKHPFDCDENLVIWEFAWSPAKKGWCCRHQDKGCKTNDKFLAQMKGSDADGKLPFDCEDDSDMDSWSSDQKAWCCGYSQNSCEKFSTTSTTTTKTTTTTTNLGCRMECEIDGVKDTCKNFIQQTSVNDFLGDAQACSSAHQLILARCPACEICSEHEVGCNVLEGPTTTTPPPTTTPEPKGCYRPCLLGGIVADCRSRVQWSAEHIYFWNQTACHKAYSQVMGECDVCSDCVQEETGCIEARPADKGKEDPYDCDADYSKRDMSWSEEKKAWCDKKIRERGGPKKGESEKDKKEDADDIDFLQKSESGGTVDHVDEFPVSHLIVPCFAGFAISAVAVAWRACRVGTYVNVPGQSRAGTDDIDVPILE